MAAVETTTDGKSVRLKLRRVTGFCTHSITALARTSLAPACALVSDDLRCLGGVTEAGCSYQAIVTGSGAAAVRTLAFKWADTALANIKASITGRYRAIGAKHVPHYLAEFKPGLMSGPASAGHLPSLVHL